MAVVAEYKLKNCTASIHDDAFAGITEEENDRRIREIQRTAWRIWEAQQLRKLEAEKRSGTYETRNEAHGSAGEVPAPVEA